MIKNLQSQNGLLFGVSNVTEPAKKSLKTSCFRGLYFGTLGTNNPRHGRGRQKLIDGKSLR